MKVKLLLILSLLFLLSSCGKEGLFDSADRSDDTLLLTRSGQSDEDICMIHFINFNPSGKCPLCENEEVDWIDDGDDHGQGIVTCYKCSLSTCRGNCTYCDVCEKWNCGIVHECIELLYCPICNKSYISGTTHRCR